MSDRLPVAILAGGLATRLRPVTEKIPKSLIEIEGEPFLAHQLRLLAQHGFREAVLCTGYLTEMVEAYAGSELFGIRLSYSHDGNEPRGTAGALRRALPLLGDQFFVLYGDSYLPCPYSAIQQAFLASGKLALMTVFRNEGLWDTSNVEYDGQRILAYDKKDRTDRMHHIDYGLGLFRSRAFAEVPEEGAYDLATVYTSLLAQGQLDGYEVQERFYEMGSFVGIDEFSRYIRSR